MNKKILGIGILALVVIGLIVLGHNLSRPGLANGDIPAPEEETTATAPAPTQSLPPKATAQPKTGVATLSATPKTIMLDLSTEFARTYQKKLEAFIAKPADFDTHYVVAKWSCGRNCKMGAVIDTYTGKVYAAPGEVVTTRRLPENFVPFALNSNMYGVVKDDVVETYSFNGQQFTLVKVQKF